MDAEIDAFFGEHADSRRLFDAVRRVILSIGPAEMRVTKSQISFRRKELFAWLWMPGRYLRGNIAPLVLTLSFPQRDPSPRWKEIVEPTPGRFTHHLELRTIGEIDSEVHAWIQRAWSKAG
jgi:hypothetical protein